METDFSTAIKGIEALIFAVPHKDYLNLEPEAIVKMAGGPIAVIDCFGILSDEKIRRYFELGCEVKALGRGHIQRIKKEVQKIKIQSQTPKVSTVSQIYKRDLSKDKKVVVTGELSSLAPT
jgi:hypothetical protein